MYLSKITPEQRALYLEQAQESRAQKLALWASLYLRQTFADENYMRQVLSRNKVMAPIATEPATTKRIRQLLRRTGLDGTSIKEAVCPFW